MDHQEPLSGEKIRLLLAKNGISQAWVAKRVGISSQLLQYRLRVSDESTLKQICRILAKLSKDVLNFS